jgi:nuclear pore complex protein Nup107
MHLEAARTLASKLSTKTITENKTKAILGHTIDFQQLEVEYDEDLTEVLDGSADQKRLLRKHMVAEAKSYRELEALIECLDQIETFTVWNHMKKE